MAYGRRWIRVDVVGSDSVDLQGLEADIARAVESAGAEGVSVSARVVDAVDRDPATGKARRFRSADD